MEQNIKNHKTALKQQREQLNMQKENIQKLPLIPERNKITLVTKYFNRHDIVKDRSQKNLNHQLIENSTTKHNRNLQLFSNKKYNRIISKSYDNLVKENSKFTQNKSVEYFKEKQKPRLCHISNQSNLQNEMKEWGLIKKKNEYEVFKLKRKNNYERMKSNMIISDALSAVMNVRQKILLDEEFNDIKLSKH